MVKNNTTNLLFICSRNQWRSPTAEAIYRKQSGYAARSRGTSKKAVRHISAKDLLWADIIFVMERKHSQRLRAEFPRETRFKKPIVLDIPDDYKFGDPILIELLRSKIDPLLSTRCPSQTKQNSSSSATP